MPQTRFVTRKALELGLVPVVVINKVDRPDARPLEVHDEVLDLFIELEATDDQLDAAFLYASGRDGWASLGPEARSGDLGPLFETILASVPAPTADPDGPFQMLASTLDYSSYVGGAGVEGIEGRVTKLYGFDGLSRVEIEEASAGDIVAVAGLEGVEIGQTLTDPDLRERLLGIAVEEPTLSVDFRVNDGPFAGKAGKYVTTRQLRERLYREIQSNVSLGVEDTEQPDTFAVSGRGELHLTILMETMRREGYEFTVSRPRVILKERPDGEVLEPYEKAVIEVPQEMVGVVMEKMGSRRAEVLDMRPTDAGPVRLDFRIPARGLFGYRSEFLTDTRGEGQLHHGFLEYGPRAGSLQNRSRGALVADREGAAVAFAIFNLQARGVMFVEPGEAVYSGMIVGESSRPGDMEINICKEKKLTNIRAAAADESIRLEPPREITLELALEFINDDELIEVTPDAIRLRKRQLSPTGRKKEMRQAAALAREA
jgi:GTP-binding protein